MRDRIPFAVVGANPCFGNRTEKHADQIRAAPAACGFHPEYLSRAIERHRSLVGPFGHQRVEYIDDTDNAREERDGIAAQLVWITAAVESFMMMSDDWANVP